MLMVEESRSSTASAPIGSPNAQPPTVRAATFAQQLHWLVHHERSDLDRGHPGHGGARPWRPPTRARTPATRSHGLEKLAKLDTRHSGPSSRGMEHLCHGAMAMARSRRPSRRRTCTVCDGRCTRQLLRRSASRSSTVPTARARHLTTVGRLRTVCQSATSVGLAMTLYSSRGGRPPRRSARQPHRQRAGPDDAQRWLKG